MVKIAVVFHSATGNTAELADAVASGAEEAGAETRVRRVRELWPADDGAGGSDVLLAELSDLEWADAFAFGTPTRFGLVSAELKAFLDQAGPLWQRGALVDKAVTAFTGAHTEHGGHETTIASLHNVFTHWGCVIVPLGYTHPAVFRTGNPYGSSWRFHEGTGPDDETLAVARHQGHRLATVAARLRGTHPSDEERAGVAGTTKGG
jgi:NAD(P)H dehydrogenase (quinone)